MYDIFLLIATVAVTFIVATDVANRRWGKIQARDGLFVAIMEDVDGAEEYAIIHAGLSIRRVCHVEHGSGWRG